jgi:hypothetical protein
MPFSRFAYFVEGVDDEDFFSHVGKPAKEGTYDYVSVHRYAHVPTPKVNAMLRGFRRNGWDYLFVCDLNDSPCVSQKKATVIQRYPSLAPEEILVVKKEIESWYVGGLDEAAAAELSIEAWPATEGVSKEMLKARLGRRGLPMKVFLRRALAKFSSSLCAERNSSFRYFRSKHLN